MRNSFLVTRGSKRVKDDEQGDKTAKGKKKNVIKIMNIKHEDYKDVLFNNKQMHHTMKTIRSKNHQLGSYELNKVSLSCFDDKDTYWAV